MAAQAASWIGQRVLGKRYEIVSELGRGGMAVVYRARDTRLSCDVVIKVPSELLLQDAEFSRRFGGELQALVPLSHPYLIHVLDAGEFQGMPFAVLQFVGGGSLRARHPAGTARVGASPHRDLRSWLPQVASALDYIHGQPSVHRDVKPDNILFDAEGKPHLSDFAIVKTLAASNPTRQSLLTAVGEVLETAAYTAQGRPLLDVISAWTGEIHGTAQYMAPELIHGLPYDGRADQFALAVTVYEVLAGKMPFDGPTLTAIARQQEQQPPRLDKRVPGIPEHAALAVQQALHVDPERRFKTCEAFAGAVLTAGTAMPRPERAPRPAAMVVPPPATVVETAAVYCPHCRKKVGVRARLQGKKAQCVHCQTTFVVPRLAEMPATQFVQTPSSPGSRGRRRWLGCVAVLLIALAALGGWGLANYQALETFWDEICGK